MFTEVLFIEPRKVCSMAGERAACIAPDNVWVLFNCSLDFLRLGRQEKQAKTSPFNIGRTLSGILFSYTSYNERTIQKSFMVCKKNSLSPLKQPQLVAYAKEDMIQTS